MTTKTWTVAPSGYLQTRDLGARPVLGEGCDRSVSPAAPVGGSGLPVGGIGVPMPTAAPFGTRLPAHIASTDTRFNGTSLGISSSRRPSS
jgi:hypothetical protein